VLQRRLGSGARVVNRGVNAYGTGQQLLLLESLLDGPPGAVPDVVTVLFCGNDLSDNVDPKHGARPWFRLEDGRLVRENCPVARSFTGGLRNLSRHSLALSFVRYNVNRLAGLARESLAAEEDDTPEPPAEETVEAARTAAEESERRWELERALLGAMADACREAGAELRVVYVSQVTQVATDAPAPDESRARMAALCEELGLPYLDPTPRFHEAWRASDEPGENGEPLFFARDWHWTAAGHALVGELLADAWSWPGRSD
jgi:lysophospholipase L1-like esterase